MSVLDSVYRIFMFVVPYAICFAAYVWVGKKAFRVQSPSAKIIALVIIAAGVGYTIYRLLTTARTFYSNDNFEYIVLIVMVADLALASIVMAIGEPETK